MKILYADKTASLDDLKNLVNNPLYAISHDITDKLPSTDSLAEKLTNYGLSPAKFEIVTDGVDKLWEVLERVDYKEVTWDVLYDSLLHGGGAESWFLNKSNEVKVKKLDPLSLIVIKETEYDEPHTVVYWEILADKTPKMAEERTFFDDKRVFIDNGEGLYVYEKGDLIDEVFHGLGVPSINVLSPFKGKPFFNKQIKTIERYENTEDFLDKETKSTLNILIMPDKAEKIKRFDDLRVIEGVNMGGGDQGKPELLVKQPEYEGTFKHKEALEKRIAKETGIIDFSSQDNAGQDASGEALKLRLMTIEDKCQRIYPKLTKFLKNRNKIIAKLGKFEFDEEEVTLRLATNMPKNALIETQAVTQKLMAGIISLETARVELGYDPETEQKKIEEEDEFGEENLSVHENPSPKDEEKPLKNHLGDYLR